MNIALLSRPRTQAILDGRLKPEGLPIHWFPISDPLGWALPAAEKDRSISSGKFAGGEMSISSFIRAKSQGAPLFALPIFLKRGLVQRSLFCSFDSTLVSPEQLRGKRVGLVYSNSSMATWMRGVLEEEYKLSRSSPQWFTLTPSSPRTFVETKLAEIPKEFVGEEIEAWEELDGYAHKLERRELFLISLLEKGELDAVVSYKTRIAANNIRPLLPTEEKFWSHYQKRGVYPINHIFVMQEEVFSKYPNIFSNLLSLFKESHKLWLNYLPEEKRGAMEKEVNRLGWDPFAYHLGEVEKRSLETFIDYLIKEKVIPRKISLDKLFHVERKDD
jgi:4,5-dihydroxyphthalate decarboxylase